jgi:hypothetical protein
MKSKKKIKRLTIFLDNGEPMETDGAEFDNMDDFIASLGIADPPAPPPSDAHYTDAAQLAQWRDRNRHSC